MEKQRLDAEIVERGLVTGRDRAKGVIMAGQIYVNNQKADKAGMLVAPGDRIELRGESLRYVSRGGLKLEKAMEEFRLSLDGLTCADIGASTGGFTDCMLQNGAARVYAVDVGYGQLAWKLRTDPRVVNLERQNVRFLSPEQIPEMLNFFSADLSFISLKLVFPVLASFLKPMCKAVCLVKPQFEAGRENVGKKGVVRDPEIHKRVIAAVAGYAAENGLSPLALAFSPIKGPEGNIEYLMLLRREEETVCGVGAEQIEAAVAASHAALDKPKGDTP